jgi:hypothetical protein
VTLFDGVLGLQFPNEVSAYIRNHADREEVSKVSAFSEQRIRACRELADYVVGRTQDDYRLAALQQVQAALQGDTDRFDPGEQQATFIASLGTAPRYPAPDESLLILIAAGVLDVRDRYKGLLREGQEALARESALEARAEQAENIAAGIEPLETALADERERVRLANEQIAHLEEQVEALRARKFWEPKPKATPKPKSSAKPTA